MGITVVTFIFSALGILANLALITFVEVTVEVLFGLLLVFLFCHCGWFCVVKRKGCCGQVGYLVWGLIYFVFPFWPLVKGALEGAGVHIHNLVCLLECVPLFYMLVCLVRLFQRAGAGLTR